MTVQIRKLATTQSDFRNQLANVLAFEAKEDESINTVVANVLADVRENGDKAVLEYTRRFDRLSVNSVSELEISKAEWEAALASLSPERRAALHAAADRVRQYHEYQKRSCGSNVFTYTDTDGTLLGQKITPLDSVGIYVPGGKAAYPSSVLMNAIPANVAGVSEIVMVVPTPDGARNELVLAAYVAVAKRRVFGTVGSDMIAGPSEILVVCDGTTDPDWVAMDLFSQAEHDEMAQSILIAPDAAYLDRVNDSIQKLLPGMIRKDIITKSLSSRGAMILVRDMAEACEIANRIAPEHLEISAENPERWAELIRHAGAIFLGRFTSEALGDYCAGPNHVLPTSRTARFSSPLGV